RRATPLDRLVAQRGDARADPDDQQDEEREAEAEHPPRAPKTADAVVPRLLRRNHRTSPRLHLVSVVSRRWWIGILPLLRILRWCVLRISLLRVMKVLLVVRRREGRATVHACGRCRIRDDRAARMAPGCIHGRTRV